MSIFTIRDGAAVVHEVIAATEAEAHKLLEERLRAMQRHPTADPGRDIYPLVTVGQQEEAAPADSADAAAATEGANGAASPEGVVTGEDTAAKQSGAAKK